MSREKTTLEIIAPTPEEAIERGLSQLGLPLEAVEVEVLDAGSRGLFGIGGRQARVRLMIKEDGPARPEAGTQRVKQVAAAGGAVSAPPAAELEEDLMDESSFELDISRQVVENLLQNMKVHATVKTSYLPQNEEESPGMIVVEILGNDLSILIGRRSETLNALQYIAALIVCKKTGHWVPLMIDVQGYRSRRERQLRQLARRMAEQAVHTGRRQYLEPMPSNERRIIHLELRDHEEVATESTGEEPNRKVTIYLKK